MPSTPVSNPLPPQGPVFPNASATGNFTHLACGDPDATGAEKGPGCLYNILSDPYETNDLAIAYPHIVAELRSRMREAQATVYNPNRGPPDHHLFCKQATENGGFIGPFLP